MTSQWKDVFCQRDQQWDALPKLRAIHRNANSGMTATWLARQCSPNIAYLVVDTAGENQLFHHFNHNVNDGLNNGTNQLQALQGGSSMAQAVSIRPDQLSIKQKSYAIEWTTMTAWTNSTDAILAEVVERRVKKYTPKAARAGRAPGLGAQRRPRDFERTQQATSPADGLQSQGRSGQRGGRRDRGVAFRTHGAHPGVCNGDPHGRVRIGSH
jgi:hypothetical protein